MKKLFLVSVATAFAFAAIPVMTASAMPQPTTLNLANVGDDAAVLVKGGRGHGRGHMGRGGRGHHYGWSRGRHRGWR